MTERQELEKLCRILNWFAGDLQVVPYRAVVDGAGRSVIVGDGDSYTKERAIEVCKERVGFHQMVLNRYQRDLEQMEGKEDAGNE